MKKLILAIALLMTVVSISWGYEYKNYFCPGTEWTLKYYANIPGGSGPEESIYTVRVVKDTILDSRECVVIAKDINDPHPTILNVDGKKVWIRDVTNSGINDQDRESEWGLLYDFGLSVGEETTVCAQGVTDRNVLVKCESYLEDSGESIVPIMMMGEYDDYGAGPEKVYDDIKWIPGVGSEYGFITNIYGGVVGNYTSTTLLKVTYEGETIYQKDGITGVDAPESAPVQKSGIMYDLYGRRIEKPLKGQMYVSDGKPHIAK